MQAECKENPFLQVQSIVAEFSGIHPEKIQLDSQLYEDLGIVGEDGVDLFELIDDQFNVDWNNLDIGIHFGNEGFGFPPPWMLEDNCCLFEPQPCSIQDIADAIETGIWKGTERIKLPQRERNKIYILSVLQTFIPLSIFAVILIKIFI